MFTFKKEIFKYTVKTKTLSGDDQNSHNRLILIFDPERVSKMAKVFTFNDVNIWNFQFSYLGILAHFRLFIFKYTRTNVKEY